MNRRALLRSGLIFSATVVCLTVAIYHFAAPLLDLLRVIPAGISINASTLAALTATLSNYRVVLDLLWYRTELQWLMPAFHIDSLTWRLDRSETVAAHVWVHSVLILSLVASWPGMGISTGLIQERKAGLLGLRIQLFRYRGGKVMPDCNEGKWFRRHFIVTDCAIETALCYSAQRVYPIRPAPANPL
jgi:hypothetical protein